MAKALAKSIEVYLYPTLQLFIISVRMTPNSYEIEIKRGNLAYPIPDATTSSIQYPESGSLKNQTIRRKE